MTLLRSLSVLEKYALQHHKGLQVFYATLMPYACYSYFHIAPWVTGLFLFIRETKLTGRGSAESLF